MNESSEGETPHEWTWWVEAKLATEDREERYYAPAPHRAGAKQYVEQRADGVEWFGEVSIPPETWDCPECGVHEAAMKLPNMKGKWDWECMHCFAQFIGHPYDPEMVRS